MTRRKDDEPEKGGTGGSPQEEAVPDAEAAVVSDLNRELSYLREFLSYLYTNMNGGFVRDDQGQPLSQEVRDYFIGLWNITNYLGQKLHPSEGEQERFEVVSDGDNKQSIIFPYDLMFEAGGAQTSPLGSNLTRGRMIASYCLPTERVSLLTLDFQPDGTVQSGEKTWVEFEIRPSDSHPGGIIQSLDINAPRVGITRQIWTLETFLSHEDMSGI